MGRNKPGLRLRCECACSFMRLEAGFSENRLCVRRNKVFEKRPGGYGIVRMGGDEPYDCSRCINFAGQNADDRHFLLVGKDVAEVKHADVNVAAEETLLCSTHGAGAARTGWVKTHGIGGIGCVIGTDPALSSDLVADPEVLDRLRRSLPGSREFGVLISDRLRRQ